MEYRVVYTEAGKYRVQFCTSTWAEWTGRRRKYINWYFLNDDGWVTKEEAQQQLEQLVMREKNKNIVRVVEVEE